MKIAGWFAAATFVLCAAVQWNDPDPAAWIAAYLFAAAVSVAAGFGVPVRPVAAIAAFVYAAFAIIAAPDALSASLYELVAPAMKTVEIEEARESLGLAICAIWMATVACFWPRR